MRVLSLFSGIGAHDLGLEWAGMEIVGQVEIDEYCQTILKKHWPKVKRWRDVQAVTASDIRRRCGAVDLITGGFPCQDISTAGKGKGIVEGQRSSLWWEMWRIIKEVRPSWLLIENVPALRTRGADGVLASLEAIGYTCWPTVVGAVHVGAPHERRRVWIVGYTENPRQSMGGVSSRIEKKESGSTNTDTAVANADSINGTTSTLERECAVVATAEISAQPGINSDTLADTNGNGIWEQPRWGTGASGQAPIFDFPNGPGPDQKPWEEPRAIKPEVGRSTNGTSRRLAIKALGNANPPQVVAVIGRAIMKVQQTQD